MNIKPTLMPGDFTLGGGPGRKRHDIFDMAQANPGRWLRIPLWKSAPSSVVAQNLRTEEGHFVVRQRKMDGFTYVKWEVAEPVMPEVDWND